jgi:two-component system, OmpR family, sensor histidine kinase BaeS
VSGPLDTFTSLKTRLGALVAVSVAVAALLVVLGSASGVPVLLAVPVSVALALGVTQLLAAGMVAPLRQMTEVSQRMARGDWSGRVRATSADEVGRLAAAFNQMAADLGRVDAERRDLIATVSHELRTPLAATTAVLENLADGVVPADEEHVGQALAQVERLSTLVNDLLDLSRVEAGAAVLRTEPTRVGALVGECARLVTAAGRAGAFDLAVPDDLVALVDPDRFRQLLTNVLDNAARHTPAGHAVHVAAGSGQVGWWLEVLDDGPGVAEPERERVFDRFGTDPAGGGTGLGLAVARWVAQLHGGTLRFVDPPEGTSGARLRLELPGQPPVHRPQEALVTTTVPDSPPEAVPAAPAPPGGLDGLFARFWPERPGSAGLRIVVTCAVVGLLAGALMTFQRPGLSWTVVLLAAGAAAYVTARHRRDAFTITCTVLSALLVLPVMLLDNAGVAFLGVLTSAAVFLSGSTAARTFTGVLLTGLAWPLASLRGLPWFGRSLRLVGTGGRTPALVRTVAWSLLGLFVFGALFASADAVFAHWVDALVPSLTFGDLVLRAFVAVAVFGLTLAAAYLAHNPAEVDLLGGHTVTLRNRFEWLAPVLIVDAVFAVFLLAQASAAFGGHAYVEHTTGLTYATYVHQGFGQMTVATLLTLFVVAVAAQRADDADRRWLLGSLGVLCALTLVVVASALHRMHLYQEAYGFTTVRLVVDVFEGWLGFVVLAVMVAGVLRRGSRMPRVAIVSGAVAVLALAAVNPDAWVANRNIDRYEATGKLDVDYLQSLSADAAPVIVARLSEHQAGCILQLLPHNQLAPEVRGAFWSWNLGRTRAADALDTIHVSPMPTSSTDNCGDVWAMAH